MAEENSNRCGVMIVDVGEEVSDITDEDAQHIQMFFGCAKCKKSFSDAKEVLQHVRSGQCPGAPTENSENRKNIASTPKRRRGRPKKIADLEPRVTNADYRKDDDFEPPRITINPGRRATRVSTGVIQRRSILDIIEDASARKDADVTDDLTKHTVSKPDENGTPGGRGRGRPRKMIPSENSSSQVNSQVSAQVLTSHTPKLFEVILQPTDTDGVQLPDPAYVAQEQENVEGVEVADVLDGVQVSVSEDDAQVHAEEVCIQVLADEVGITTDNTDAVEELHEHANTQIPDGLEMSVEDEQLIESQELQYDTSANEVDAGDTMLSEQETDAGDMAGLTDQLGDGDDDDDDYLPEDGSEEYFEEDEQLEEEMDQDDDTRTILAEQLATAKITQMGGSRVIELQPLQGLEENVLDGTKIVEMKVIGGDELEEIKLSLEDLQETQPETVRKGPGRPRKYDSCMQYPKNVNKRPLRCPHCPQRFFKTQEELDLHLECHVSSEMFHCVACDYETKLWNRCLDHILTHPDYKEKYKNHDFVRNIIGQYACPVCDKMFEKKNNMKGHFYKVHNKTDKCCPECQQIFPKMDDKTFARHIERCKSVQYNCPHCKYTTVISANLKKHLRIHDGTGFTCQICGKIYPTKSRLQAHVSIHDANRTKTMCDVCGQEFMTEDAAKKHIVRVHAEVNEIYQCDRCNFTAKLESDLKKHVNAVHFKKFQCGNCVFSTNSTIAFEQHKEYHKAERKFACNWSKCFYRGPTAKHLANHICQVHQTKNKHECPICQKCYKKKTHLARHLVVHTGDKPYLCLDCGVAFANHSTYYRHRARTGHDTKREGIVSVPQNIHIQYVTQDGDMKLEESQVQEGNIVPVEGAEDQDNMVLVGEEIEAEQLTYLLHIDENGQQVMVPATEEDLQALHNVDEDVKISNTELLQEGQQLLEQLDAEQLNTVEEQVVVQQDHSNQAQAIYEQVEQFDNKEHLEISEQMVNHTEGEELMETETQVINGETQETVLLQSGNDGQHFFYQDADGSMHTVVEVEHPSGESGQHQYAIIVMPDGDTGAEPEAALSMLQLQSSMQQ